MQQMEPKHTRQACLKRICWASLLKTPPSSCARLLQTTHLWWLTTAAGPHRCISVSETCWRALPALKVRQPATHYTGCRLWYWQEAPTISMQLHLLWKSGPTTSSASSTWWTLRPCMTFSPPPPPLCNLQSSCSVYLTHLGCNLHSCQVLHVNIACSLQPCVYVNLCFATMEFFAMAQCCTWMPICFVVPFFSSCTVHLRTLLGMPFMLCCSAYLTLLSCNAELHVMFCPSFNSSLVADSSQIAWALCKLWAEKNQTGCSAGHPTCGPSCWQPTLKLSCHSGPLPHTRWVWMFRPGVQIGIKSGMQRVWAQSRSHVAITVVYCTSSTSVPNVYTKKCLDEQNLCLTLSVYIREIKITAASWLQASSKHWMECLKYLWSTKRPSTLGRSQTNGNKYLVLIQSLSIPHLLLSTRLAANHWPAQDCNHAYASMGLHWHTTPNGCTELS